MNFKFHTAALVVLICVGAANAQKSVTAPGHPWFTTRAAQGPSRF